MMSIIVTSILLSLGNAEQWKIKYPDYTVSNNQQPSHPSNQDLTINRNRLAQTLDQQPPQQRPHHDGYKWIVMPQSQQSAALPPRSMSYQPLVDEQASIPQVNKYQPKEFVQPAVAVQEKVDISEPNPELVVVEEQRPAVEKSETKSEPRGDYGYNNYNMPIRQPSSSAPSQPSSIPQEYTIPQVYDNPYYYQQPTYVQSQPMPVPQSIAQNPNVQHVPMYPPASQYVQAPLYSEPTAQSPVQVESQPQIKDEYLRMDSASSETAETYCGNYNPDANGNQVLFKDQSSPIHFLTCIGKNQVQRMVCPRYTVFNEFNRRCVQRHQANDKCGPCENGGQCRQDSLDGRYRCECTFNFRGDSCELFVDPCASQPCGMGLCFNISTTPGYLCQCRDHVFNDNCNVNVINNCQQLSGSKRFYAEQGNLFVHCSDDGLAFVKKCPPGMVFNEVKETCTFPPSYTRQVMVHPPGAFRSDEAAGQNKQSRKRRNAFWAW